MGAGFAGLSAARDLVRLGYDVVVLEGRDRVGGRSATTTIAGTPVDLGGTFVGPTQDDVLALAAELGCETVPTYSRGKNLIRWRGRVRSYRSTIPRLSMLELVDVSRIQWRFERISRQVPVHDAVDGADRAQTRRAVAGRVAALGVRERLDTGPDGDRGPGDVGMRAGRSVDAARRALCQGGRWARPNARRRGRRSTGPLPRRNATDRGADGRRAGTAGGVERGGAAHRTPRRGRRDGRVRPGTGCGQVGHCGHPTGTPSRHRL